MHFFSGKRAVMVLLVVAAVLILPFGAYANSLFIPFTFDLNTFPSIPDDGTGDAVANLEVSASGGLATFTLTPTSDFRLMPGPLALNVLQSPPLTGAFLLTFTLVSTDWAGGIDKFSVVQPTDTNATFDGAGRMNTFFDGPSDTNSQGFPGTFTSLVFQSTQNFDTAELAIAALTGGSQGYIAAVDVYQISTGKTGWVGNGEPGDNPVPIPPSALLLGSGLLGLGLIGWRRRGKKS